MELEGSRYAVDSRYRRAPDTDRSPDPGNRNPVNVDEALEFAVQAFGEGRYYDANWLATLAGRLAAPGSPEVAQAARLASQAWNRIDSLAPSAREQEAARLWRLKQSGYQAMLAEDWIRGYYIFSELLGYTPNDPDAKNFLAACEKGALEIAFFRDELEMTLGALLSSAILSVPRRSSLSRQDGRFVFGENGRYVVRIGSLCIFADYAYGFDVEILDIDSGGGLRSRAEAPYVKILPKTLGGEQRTVLLLQALDRSDPDIRWGPVWTGAARDGPGEAEAVLDLAWDNFLLITKIRRGIENLLAPELVTAWRVLEPYGYIPQVFLAEISGRLGTPLLFLPLAIFVLITGWRYRSRRRQRFVAIPMLAILPFIFQGILQVYQVLLNSLGIWLSLNFSLGAALVGISLGALALFILALIILAGQRG